MEIYILTCVTIIKIIFTGLLAFPMKKKKKQFYFYIKPHLIKCRGLEKYYSSKITTKTTNCFYMYKNNKFRMVVTSGKRGRGLWRKTQRALTETVL